MLRGAVQRHEKENEIAKALASPPKAAPSQSRSSQGVNPGYRNPLISTSTSALNVLRGSQGQSRSSAGIKRTASGLAKALDGGSFEEAPGSQPRPIVIGGRFLDKNSVNQVTPNDFIDADDFDSDIDLDVEEPKRAVDTNYPSLPAPASPPQPIVYPTLPRQQQAQTHHATDFDHGYGAARISPPVDQPQSSAPLPWSSSPLEHYTTSANPSSISAFTYDPNNTQRNQSGPAPPASTSAPAKRRTLPWQSQASEQAPPPSSRFVKTTQKRHTDSTPVSQKGSKFLWNTSASAVKEQQKQHRQDNKKHIIKNAADEDAARTVVSSRNKRPPRVFLSDEQKHVLKLVDEDKKSVFFTGSAGTGKSVLMREIIATVKRKYQKEPDRVAVTASTGLAACNIGGVTLHSFAGIGLGKENVTELVKKIKRNQKAKHRWLRTKILVIDEVSMVDGDLFDKLEEIARNIRNNGRPFGGIQLVVTGDFFQLPPVPEGGKAATFAFDAGSWKTTIEHTIALHHVFRQKDPIFAGMLNEMREGRLTQSSVNAFHTLSRPLGVMDELEATELFPTRSEVENANLTRLRNLQGEAHHFPARDGGAITDKVARDRLLANCMAPESLTLKHGCQVMLIKNIDESLVNGSIGKVMGFMDEAKFDTYTITDGQELPLNADGTIASTSDGVPSDAKAVIKKRMQEAGVAPSSGRWPVCRFIIPDGTSRDLLCQPESYKIELPNGEIQASRLQVPLILAWALSIHKAQGQTLERVKVDLGKVFEKGQAYVALSRATNMAGLQVLRFDPKKVVAHERVRTFYANLSRVEMLEKDGGRSSEGPRKRSRLGAAEDYEKRFLEDEDWNIDGL